MAVPSQLPPVGHRAGGRLPTFAAGLFDLLGDQPKWGGLGPTNDPGGLTEMGARCYSSGALSAGTVVYVSGRQSVGPSGQTYGVASISAAAPGTAPGTWVLLFDVAAGGIGRMAKAAIIQVAGLDTSASSVGAVVYVTTAGAPTLTATAQPVGHVHTVSASGGSGYVAFSLWSASSSMGGSVVALDGTQSAPGYAFSGTGGLDDGFYRSADNQVAVTLAGLKRILWSTTASPTFAAAADAVGNDVYLVASNAGLSATAARVGGLWDQRAGAGSAGSTTIDAGAGGAMTSGGGAGGAKAGTTGVAGAGGAWNGSGGTGGANANTVSGAGGAGGAWTGGGGAGGNSTNAGSTGAGGAGGVTSNKGGNGGTSNGTGAGGAGGNGSYGGGAGGNSASGNGGDGGTGTLSGGNAGTGGTANGGNVDLVLGTKTGSGLAGELRVNGSTAGFIPVSTFYIPTSVDSPFFIATRAYRVKAITGRVEVAGTDAGAVTLVVKKAPSATAITAGTALHSSTFNLKGTAATNQSLTLSVTLADLEIAAGDCIGLDFTGTLTSATGCITVSLAPV